MWVYRNQVILFWQITQDRSKMEQISSTLLLISGSIKPVQNFNKNYWVAGARKNFQVFRQNTCFIKNNRALSFVLILHYLITYLSKKSVCISQFCIYYVSHVNVWLVNDQGPLVLELRTSPLSYPELWSEHKTPTIFLIVAENIQFIFSWY